MEVNRQAPRAQATLQQAQRTARRTSAPPPGFDQGKAAGPQEIKEQSREYKVKIEEVSYYTLTAQDKNNIVALVRKTITEKPSNHDVNMRHVWIELSPGSSVVGGHTDGQLVVWPSPEELLVLVRRATEDEGGIPGQ